MTEKENNHVSGLADSLSSDLVLTEATPASLHRLDLKALREYRNGLKDEEEKVSYWRRLIQHRLDLIARQQKEGHVISTRDLVRALGSTGTGVRRQQLLSIDAQDELPSLPGLEDLWTTATDLADIEGTARLVEALKGVEVQLSAYRSVLHARIDRATSELIDRYKADPNLSLTLLPAGAR